MKKRADLELVPPSLFAIILAIVLAVVTLPHDLGAEASRGGRPVGAGFGAAEVSAEGGGDDLGIGLSVSAMRVVGMSERDFRTTTANADVRPGSNGGTDSHGGNDVARFTSAPTSTWQYTKTMAIYNPGTTALVDYQVQIGVTHEAGMNADFSDIRFKASPEGTFLPYWIESYIESTSAVMWVKVSDLPAETTTGLTMYYGNASAVSASDGDAVFEFFDDFEGVSLDESKWNIITNQGTIEVTDGYLRLYRPAGGNRIHIESSPSLNGYKIIEYRQKILQSNYYYSSVYYGASPNISSIGYALYPDYESALYTGDFYYPPRCSGWTSTDGDVITDPPVNEWFTEKLTVPPGYLSRWLNGATGETSTRYSGVSSGKIGVFAFSASDSSMESYTDYIRVRKYADPEPLVSLRGPTATFSTYHEDLETTPADGDHPLSTYDIVHFKDESTDDGSIESWSWDFDYDGVTWDEDSTEQHPFHQFSASGSYTVCLTVTDNVNVSSPPYCRSINVVDGASLWTKAATVTIDNSGGVALTDYQVRVSLTGDAEGSGVDISDGWPASEGLIRFRGSDGGGGTINLPCRVEKWDGGSKTAVVWVKVKELPADVQTPITLHYGYTGSRTDANESDGEGTFVFFDDFSGTTIDTTRWHEIDNGNYLSQNDQLIATGGSGTWSCSDPLELDNYDSSSKISPRKGKHNVKASSCFCQTKTGPLDHRKQGHFGYLFEP